MGSPQSDNNRCSVEAAHVSRAAPPVRRRHGGTRAIPNSEQMLATSDMQHRSTTILRPSLQN